MAMGRDAWVEAEREARKRGLGYVGTDLLLLGLARSTGIAAEVLGELGVTVEAVEVAIDDLPRVRDAATVDHPRATPRTERLLGVAQGLAIGTGERSTNAHLLLALAYDRNGPHVGVLRTLGVARGMIVGRLAGRGVKVPPKPPPSDASAKSDQLVLPRDQAEIVIQALVRGIKDDPLRFVDGEGEGRWGFNHVDDRPGYMRIVAEPGLGLNQIAAEALRAAGFSGLV
jgi:hypothetical protein